MKQAAQILSPRAAFPATQTHHSALLPRTNLQCLGEGSCSRPSTGGDTLRPGS